MAAREAPKQAPTNAAMRTRGKRKFHAIACKPSSSDARPRTPLPRAARVAKGEIESAPLAAERTTAAPSNNAEPAMAATARARRRLGVRENIRAGRATVIGRPPGEGGGTIRAGFRRCADLGARPDVIQA